jgi:hypothetical protein
LFVDVDESLVAPAFGLVEDLTGLLSVFEIDELQTVPLDTSKGVVEASASGPGK